MKKQFLKLERVLGIFAALAMLFTGCDFANDKSQEKVETPVIALAEDGVTVSISCATADAEIFYYLNDAADSEVKYSEAFKLEEKAEATTYVVNARAQKEGFLPSEKASETFVVKAISKFTVTFSTDGGNEITAQTVIKGGVATKPEDPTKTGYKFAGWFAGETAYDFATAVNADVTLTAKWVANTYKVTFDANGGSAVAEATVNHGEKVAKPADPTKTGYKLAGWYAGETVYDFGTAVTAALTLKAKWTPEEYTITYDVGKGTNATTNPAKYTIETADITLAAPTAPAETPFFVAWHIGKADGDKVTGVAIKKGSTGNKVFVAEYTTKTLYTVTYYDGDTVITTESVVEGEKAVGNVSVGGKTLVGWYTDKELTTAADMTAPVTKNISLYGKFLNAYTVTFDVDGGSTVPSQPVTEGGKATKPADPTKAGFTFAGWYVGETAYDFNAAVTAAITLKAKWNIITYAVTFNTDGGSTVAPARVNHGEKVTKPVDPTKAGFTFGGWYAGETAYDFNTAVTAAITLKAKWTPNYTVTFDTDGGSTVAPATVKQGEKVTKPVDPTKAGTPFAGWYTADGNPYDFDTVVTADITITAKWIKKAYTVERTFNIAWDKDGNDYKAKFTDVITDDLAVGDAISVTIKGASKKAITDLLVQYVDNSEAGGWWKVLSNQVKINGTLAADTDFERTVVLVIKDTPAEGSGERGKTLVLSLKGTEAENLSASVYPNVASIPVPKPQYTDIPEGAIVVANFTAMDSIPSSITLPTYGRYQTGSGLTDDDTYSKVLNLVASGDGDYGKMNFQFSEPVNLTGKQLVVRMKGDFSTATDPDHTIAFLLFSSENPQKASEENWLKTESATSYETKYTGDVKNFYAAYDNSKDKNGDPVDFTAVTNVQLHFKLATYSIRIAAIYFIDVPASE